MMDPLGDRLKENRRITIIDLPGFGLSEEPDYPYSVSDYADFVHDLLAELNISKPVLIGHSFGGRISIVYASKYDVDKLVLFGSPCVRHAYVDKKQKLLKSIKKIKILKPFVNIVKKHSGSVDYRNASALMRDVLVKTVNTDLSEN